MRDMAVVAHRDGVVRTALPAVVLVVHDVAVDARLGIVAHVRCALGVVECERADTDGNADENGEEEREMPQPQTHGRLSSVVSAAGASSNRPLAVYPRKGDCCARLTHVSRDRSRPSKK